MRDSIMTLTAWLLSGARPNQLCAHVKETFVQQMNLHPIPNTIDISDLEDGFWAKEVGSVNSFDNNDDYNIT